VAVVGGGWAGLAAAVEATRLGDKVTLFEMAPTLGGRARTVWLGQGSERQAFDNGQHILIGAYRETLRLMQLIGGEPHTTLLRTPLTLVDGTGIGLRLPEAWANRYSSREVTVRSIDASSPTVSSAHTRLFKSFRPFMTKASRTLQIV
jgi:uncharacterized protein with NAD-binding domain and iron-sulfur cluster